MSKEEMLSFLETWFANNNIDDTNEILNSNLSPDIQALIELFIKAKKEKGDL
ncbi:hypothetical protein [Paenibacillus chitinolyticus]|uniref:hypothetical protein n=1 Tax=Paenibacillus chitinolyticus TaxID=79263 RepID=UPI003D091A31